MESRIILTIDQARTLQRSGGEWPGQWQYLLETKLPVEPDILHEPLRMIAGLKMLSQGCSEEQVAEQLMWKPTCGAVKTLMRLYRQEEKERKKEEARAQREADKRAKKAEEKKATKP